MAEFRIVVVVDPSRAVRGTKQVERQLNRTANAADRTRQLIGRAFAFVGIAAGVRQLVLLTDTFTNIQNRLGTVTKSTAELNLVTDELFKIANRTRSSFEGTAEVYARVGLAAKELGVSQSQLLSFTESLNQAVILSGASAQEAQAGLIQLSQGLASGALRGDELRSVLEQLPVVADVIAKSMGITRGELRELGAQGKITADIVLKAFSEAREELEGRFAKTVPTISQSFQVLRNNMIGLIGQFNQATGAAGFLSKAILAVSENLEVLIRVAGGAALALGIKFAVQGVGAAVRAIATLTAALLANPFTALLVAVTLAISLLITFSDQISVGEGRLANLQDLGQAVFEALGKAVDIFISFFEDNFGFVADLAKDVFGDVELSVEGVLKVAAKVVDGTVGFFKGAAVAIKIAFENVPAALEAVFKKAINGVINLYQKFIGLIIKGLNLLGADIGTELVDTLGQLKLTLSPEAEAIGERMDQAIADGINSQNAASDALDGILARSEEIARQRIQRQKAEQAKLDAARNQLGTAGAAAGKVTADSKLFSQIIKDLEDEAKLLRMSNAERQIAVGLLDAERKLKRALTDAERAQVEQLLRGNQARMQENELLDEIQGPQEQYAQNLATLQRLLARGAITQEQFNQQLRDMRIALLETETGVFAGFERGFLKAQKDMEDFAAASERVITDAFSEAQDAVVGFFKTGKFEADDFFRSLADNLLKLGVQQAFAAAFGQQGIGGLLGGGGGGGGGGGIGGGIGGLIAGAIGSFAGFQNGGSFTVGAGTAAARIPGLDNRLVAFRAQDGEKVSVTPKNERGATNAPINQVFNITTPDADSFRRSQTQVQNKAVAGLNRARSRR